MSSSPRPSFAVRAFNRVGRFNPGVQRLKAELHTERERSDRFEAELSRVSDLVEALNAELGELRRDSLRVAELTDLVEQRLQP